METKKIAKLVIVFLVVCMVGMVTIGCVSMKVQDQFMNPGFSKTEHSVLIVDPSINLHTLDGRSISTFVSASSGKRWIVFLAPGIHTLDSNYGKVSVSSGVAYTTTTTETAENLKATYDFIAGHYYSIDPLKSGKTVSISIKDITDSPDKEDKKLIQTVTQKTSKTTGSYLPESLLKDSSDPTPIEGTWRFENKDGDFSEFVFTGNNYEVSRTNIATRLVQVDGKTQVVQYKYIEESKGRFEYTDKKIILYKLSALNYEKGEWTTSLGGKSEYDYVLTSDSLTFTYKLALLKFKEIYYKEE